MKSGNCRHTWSKLRNKPILQCRWCKIEITEIDRLHDRLIKARLVVMRLEAKILSESLKPLFEERDE